MAIPDYQTVMLPLLQLAGDGKEHSIHDAIDSLAARFKLSEKERAELLPSGKQPVFDNRVGWARTYMKKAGLLESTRRAYFKITKSGADVLTEKPSRINKEYLERFPEFVKFQEKHPKPESIVPPVETPEEMLEAAYESLRETLASELLEQLHGTSPSRFERIVVELLVAMGYGGSLKDAGLAIGKSGDEGIDGIIKEDKLGLDVVYIQAKRWKDKQVSRPEIQKFVGALHGQHAKKGVFIATSTFSKDAETYAKGIDSKVILIDGERLANLMIDHGVGVSSVNTIEIKKIDLDYFNEE